MIGGIARRCTAVLAGALAVSGMLPQNATASVYTSPTLFTPAAAICDGDGVTGKRVQLMYVRGIGEPDRFPEMESNIQGWADRIDAAVLEGAQRTGGVRHVRFVHHASCRPVVLNVAIPASELDNAEKVVDALKALGHNRTDRKYLVFDEGTHDCGLAWNDPGDSDEPGEDNPLNSGPGWAVIDRGCADWGPGGHELLHSLGGVQSSAPHGTEFGHCWDDQDIMCYDDGGLPDHGLKIECPSAEENIVDCNNDDYFNTAPADGTYLADHWNVADSQFLTARGPGSPVQVGNRAVTTARAGATAYATKYQLPDGRWTAKARIVTNAGSPFQSSVLAVRTSAGIRHVPPDGVPRGATAHVTVEANDVLDIKLCEGNADGNRGCTATWW
ncbi:ricin-type beta-trefoil lectin domain protein [Actinosynnema sp. CS-041913]|uniref:ricin-type beta-trefoil lectin domain protein n=1 Tax=Actinosynnema sp. CS-041913 TaxID=3239917 RepID=UPI003D94FDDC